MQKFEKLVSQLGFPESISLNNNGLRKAGNLEIMWSECIEHQIY